MTAISELRAEVHQLKETVRRLESHLQAAAPRRVRLARKTGTPTGTTQPVIFQSGNFDDRQSTSKYSAIKLSGDNLIAIEQDGQWFYCPCGSSEGEETDCTHCSDGLPNPLCLTVSGIADGTAPAGTADALNGVHELGPLLTPDACARTKTVSVPGGNEIFIDFQVINSSGSTFHYALTFEESPFPGDTHEVRSNSIVLPALEKPNCKNIVDVSKVLVANFSNSGIHPDYSNMVAFINKPQTGIVFRKQANLTQSDSTNFTEAEPAYDTATKQLYVADGDSNLIQVHGLNAALTHEGDILTFDDEVLFDAQL